MNILNNLLELKFASPSAEGMTSTECEVSGYASLFDIPDQLNDVLVKGAFTKSLERQKARGSKIKMLWQHDPSKPIGVWDEVIEDNTGLYVRGRILEDVDAGKETLSLLRAGAIDGLSIGYRLISAQKDKSGVRILTDVDLWEVSLVTFPMLIEARAKLTGQKNIDHEPLFKELRELRSVINLSNEFNI